MSMFLDGYGNGATITGAESGQEERAFLFSYFNGWVLGGTVGIINPVEPDGQQIQRLSR
jgi:hypothetical protein